MRTSFAPEEIFDDGSKIPRDLTNEHLAEPQSTRDRPLLGAPAAELVREFAAAGLTI